MKKKLTSLFRKLSIARAKRQNPRQSNMPIEFILLSYPRSGNHWLRYIIEWFSGKPTLGAGEGEDERDSLNPIDTPIYSRVPIAHMDTKALPIAKKRHKLNLWDNRQAGLVLVVRNYKECVVRHLQLSPDWSGNLDSVDSLVECELQNYWELIDSFNQWPSRKHLISYESLIQDSRSTIEALLKFMQLTPDKAMIDEFFDNYDWHRKNSLKALIAPSSTRGENVVSHSRNLTEVQRIQWDQVLRTKSPSLYETYLKVYEDEYAQVSK